MTGVYILHYSIFHLLSTAFIPIGSLTTKLMLIALTFITLGIDFHAGVIPLHGLKK